MGVEFKLHNYLSLKQKAASTTNKVFETKAAITTNLKMAVIKNSES